MLVTGMQLMCKVLAACMCCRRFGAVLCELLVGSPGAAADALGYKQGLGWALWRRGCSKVGASS